MNLHTVLKEARETYRDLRTNLNDYAVTEQGRAEMDDAIDSLSEFIGAVEAALDFETNPTDDSAFFEGAVLVPEDDEWDEEEY